MNENKKKKTAKLYIDTYRSPLGTITMMSDGIALKGLWIEGQDFYAEIPEEMTESETCPVFEQTKRWLDIYFSGRVPDFIPPLAPDGSGFRQRVWELLLEIPYGEVTTYGKIADRIADERGMKRMAAQAVGGAVGHNPISIIIPCHRVIGKDGSLTGYTGGLDKKIFLLGLEKSLDVSDCQAGQGLACRGANKN